MTDWVDWHVGYHDPSSPLSARLRRVQAHLADALAAAPPGPVSLVSLCAGQGHDVLGVLPGHPRCDDVTAVLVEADEDNAERARHQARLAGLPQVEVRTADASRVASLAGALPADVLLLCGIFGNIRTGGIRPFVAALPAMCAVGATVIWTRHRKPPDLTPALRSWFVEQGFDEIAFEPLETSGHSSVGVSRLRQRATVPLPSGPLFTFRPARRSPGCARERGYGRD